MPLQAKLLTSIQRREVTRCQVQLRGISAARQEVPQLLVGDRRADLLPERTLYKRRYDSVPDLLEDVSGVAERPSGAIGRVPRRRRIVRGKDGLGLIRRCKHHRAAQTVAAARARAGPRDQQHSDA